MAAQFLTFTLDRHIFGIDILRVQELKGFSAITPLPNTPPHVRGVMNLRGTIVPVVDLRTRFGISSGEYHKYTVIVVVSIGAKVMGLAVDGVADVLTLADDEIQTPPAIGMPIDVHLVAGLANVDESLVVLLDVDRVLAPNELAQLNAA